MSVCDFFFSFFFLEKPAINFYSALYVQEQSVIVRSKNRGTMVPLFISYSLSILLTNRALLMRIQVKWNKAPSKMNGRNDSLTVSFCSWFLGISFAVGDG